MDGFMPTIRPSADLRNNYNEISELCQLYTLIDEGLTQVKEGRVKTMKGTIKSIREKIKL